MSRDANPLIVSLFFLARCLAPLLFMLAVSYVLKRLGLLPETPPPPENSAQDRDDHTSGENNGGVVHGAACDSRDRANVAQGRAAKYSQEPPWYSPRSPCS